MTFHIGLHVKITESHAEDTPTGDFRIVSDMADSNVLSYWSNQVPEKGDQIHYWSPTLKRAVYLTVTSRTWVLTGNTGGPRGPHDVEVVAEGTT